jgi:hypothetical protein
VSFSWVMLRDRLGDAGSSLGDAKSSLGDAKSSLGDTESSLRDAKGLLGDANNPAVGHGPGSRTCTRTFRTTTTR